MKEIVIAMLVFFLLFPIALCVGIAIVGPNTFQAVDNIDISLSGTYTNTIILDNTYTFQYLNFTEGTVIYHADNGTTAFSTYALSEDDIVSITFDNDLTLLDNLQSGVINSNGDIVFDDIVFHKNMQKAIEQAERIKQTND